MPTFIRSRPLAIGLAGLGLVGALAGCSAATGSDGSTTGSNGAASDDGSGSSATGPYKDGTYSADGSYQAPSGTETITVTLTLADDKVSKVDIGRHATDPNAVEYQKMFASGISSVVVGKDVDSLGVSRVAGSSLTSGGFRARRDQEAGGGVLSAVVDPLPHAWRFEAIGTPWRIDTARELTPPERAAIAERIERYDRDWSRFRDDSLVSRIAREAGSYELPPEAGPLLGLYRELYEATDGRVSPLVGRALEALGYDARYRLTPAPERIPVPAWDAAIAWDGRRLDAPAPVLLDVGAAGKGQLVDLVGDVLSRVGHERWVVDASGDLRPRAVPMRVALEHPADPSRAIGVIETTDRAIAASATTRRAWGDGLHHVLDAVTGEPTRGVVATWAIARSALIADGVATALFFDVDPDLLTRHDVEYVRMFADGRVQQSPGLPGEVFA